MKFSLENDIDNQPVIDELIDLRFEIEPSNEDFMNAIVNVAKKMYEKIEIFFGRHVTLAKHIQDNMEGFKHLKKDTVVKTVMPKDLSIVSNALEYTNKALEKLQLGDKIDMVAFCNQNPLKLAGVRCDQGHIMLADFKNGHWGEGLNVDNIKSPMVFRKTIEEFKWDTGAAEYAQRFCNLVNATNKGKVEDGAKRHFKDLSKSVRKGLSHDRVAEDEKVAVNQISELNAARDAFISFYYKQLVAILSASDIPVSESPQMGDNYYRPKTPWVPDTWVGE